MWLSGSTTAPLTTLSRRGLPGVRPYGRRQGPSGKRSPGSAAGLRCVDGVTAVQVPGGRGDIGVAIGAVEVVRQIDAVPLTDRAAGEVGYRALRGSADLDGRRRQLRLGQCDARDLPGAVVRVPGVVELGRDVDAAVGQARRGRADVVEA